MATRDLPKSFDAFAFGWTRKLGREITLGKNKEQLIAEDEQPEGWERAEKVKAKNLWPAFVAGAGLFSDGYINNSISTVSYCLGQLYKDEYTKSHAINNVSSIAFVGTVVGQLSFGYIADRIARKGGLMAATSMMILFTILTAAATWGAGGSINGLFNAIVAMRFFLGISIGAEYPTASVMASEFANMLPPGHRNRYFSWFTNSMIDLGFIISAFVPLVLLWIFSHRHLTAVWRMTLGLGAIPPIALFFMRLKVKDSAAFDKLHMKKVKKFPLWLVIKFYWFRLIIVSLIWFIYDFGSYSFGIYSTYIIGQVIPNGDIYKTFGWNVVFNLFYIPGTFLGAIAADYFGPRLTLGVGVIVQAIIGFIMAACYPTLKHHIGAFVVVYGIFTTLGEFGPGNNIGLLASKTSATPIRGQYYGIAAAVGKIGAFVGTWVFPVIIKNTSSKTNPNRGNQMPFYISSAMCVFSGIICLVFCPSVAQDAINREDEEFLEYLEANGFDTSQMGEGIVAEESDDLEDGSSGLKKNEEIIKVETSSKHSI